jgi:hypothetical protein
MNTAIGHFVSVTSNSYYRVLERYYGTLEYCVEMIFGKDPK